MTVGRLSPLCGRVLHALAINRKAKLNFPGVFMGIAGHATEEGNVDLGFEDDDVFREAGGELNWAALGVLVDIALSTVTRFQSGPTLRPATVQLQMQMTGAPRHGRVVTHGLFEGHSERTALRQTLTSGTVVSGETVIAHATAAFVMLPLAQGQTQMALPWVPEGLDAAPLELDDLSDEEREALRICARAERAATEAHPFIEHFWCGVPKTGDGKASLSVKVAPHLANRVGQVHGGVLFGTAARVASAAAPEGMRLSNITAWFISPGLPPRFTVRSRVVERSRNLAVVHTRITGATGKLVLEVTSQHIAGERET